MHLYRLLPAAFCTALCLQSFHSAKADTPMNLILNPHFDFHSFDNSRHARPAVFSSGYAACWNTDAYNDIIVTTTGHVTDFTPAVFTRNVVTIKPGKRIFQVIFLPDIGVMHGERVSFSVRGMQERPDSLRATVRLLKIDSSDGAWSPADFGMSDTRTFPRHSRGELVAGRSYDALSGAEQDFHLTIEGCEITGNFVRENVSGDAQENTIALEVELANSADEGNVHVYALSLVRGETAREGLPTLRTPPTFYAGIPRTIRKLWRGEPLHILVMGSSIDRGSANPPMYLYDEDRASPTFKQPLAEGLFDGELVGRPDLSATVGQWRHYFSWAGRLRTELLRKFDYPPDRLLIHFMACDGSSISESVSGLTEYTGLMLPPNPELNGQPEGSSWEELYPGLFDRFQGSGPDLVLFGSGANEKTDEPDEGAIFEGVIRWIQRLYPDCEFLFCMWQRDRRYTANTGHLMELALNYNIPFIDLGDRIDQLLQYANPFALCPSDGHPQAAAHYIWGKTVEQAFEVADPIAPGRPQLHLPPRLHPNSYHWEGEIVTYEAPSPRFNGPLMIIDDSAVNCWASGEGEGFSVTVDGIRKGRGQAMSRRNIRNSVFTLGRLALGDRHVLEVRGDNPVIVAVDCIIPLNREWIGVEDARWLPVEKSVESLESSWGAPYGEKQVKLAAGQALEVTVAATDLSVATVDSPSGGTMRVWVNGRQHLETTTAEAYTDVRGEQHYMENRRGVRNLGYGTHHVRVEAVEGTVELLGLFTYDTR